MRQVYRNFVMVTSVYSSGKTFGFGVVMEKKPRTVFFPAWVVKTFNLTENDQGSEIDCLFIDALDGKHPMVIGIIDDEEQLAGSEIVGTYTGQPGTDGFTFKLSLGEMA